MVDIRSYEPGEATFFKLPNNTYISVEVEKYPYSPRELGDGLGTFLTWGRGYVSVDENPYRDEAEFVETMLGEDVAESCRTMGDVIFAFREKGYAFKGIYRFEHGGVSYSLGDANPYADRWDSGPVGFAYVSPEKLFAEGMSVEQALTYMEAEMREYSAYADGDVWLVKHYTEQGEYCDISSYYGLDAVEEEYGFVIPVKEITSEQALTLMSTGEPVFDNADQKAAYYRGEGEPAGYKDFKPIGRFIWKEADGSWHAMDNSLGMGINKDADFNYRQEALEFARGDHPFETAEVAAPERLDVETEVELELYATLVQEWSAVRNDDGAYVRFEKNDVAIVEDETGFWRIENSLSHELSVELFDSPLEALEALCSYQDLDKLINPLEAAVATSHDLAKESHREFEPQNQGDRTI